VKAYWEAAHVFTAKLPKLQKVKLPKRVKVKQKDDRTLSLFSDEESDAARIEEEKDRLRGLHWRVDAEILKLYALPPELERALLDSFDGVPRVGVPFDQKGYIPLDFDKVQTLDEFLKITDEWGSLDERRMRLIEKKYDEGLNTEEKRELTELKRLFDLRRWHLAPPRDPEMDAIYQRVLEKTRNLPK
jgi:hypothetical protein